MGASPTDSISLGTGESRITYMEDYMSTQSVLVRSPEIIGRAAKKPNLQDLKSYPGPAAGMQFFGTVRIAAATHTMTVRLHNLKGDTIYTVDLAPEH